jgi:outer membrane protein
MKIQHVAALVFCFLAGSVQAAQDLLDAYRAALTNDPRFRVAHYEYASAQEVIPQARAQLLPGISFDARYAEIDQDILNRDQLVFGVGPDRYNVKSWNFQASQPLFRMSAWSEFQQAKASVRQAFAEYSAAEQDLVQRTAEAYITVLAAEDNRSFAIAEQAAAAKQLEVVQGRRRGGLANVTDEYEAQARFSRVEADVIAATYTLDESYQALREIVGDAVVKVAGFKSNVPLRNPEPYVIQDWIDRALQQNLLLIAATEALEVATQEIRRRRANHYPTLDLVARHGNIDSGGSVTGGATDVDTTEVALQFSLPLYQGGAISSQTRQAEMDYNRALEERKLRHRIVMRETRASFQTVRSAISRVQALEATEKSLESALAGRQRGYESGVDTLLEVLTAESELFSTRRDLAAARYEYVLNTLRLKAQVGALSEEDLAYFNAYLEP